MALGLFPVTVAINESRFTKREVAQAKEARRIEINLGSPNPRAVAQAINCMTNVARAQAIYGRNIQVVKGSTKRKLRQPSL